jgi:hypothetical protein
VAVHNHRKEKLLLLRNAILGVAMSTERGTDMHLIFIRYLEELTPERVSLLAFLQDRSAVIAAIDSYPKLYELSRGSGTIVEPIVFRMQCEDLKSRLLLRVSQSVDDFPDVYAQTGRVTSQETPGPRFVVTEIGGCFIRFIRDGQALAERQEATEHHAT